MQCRLLPPTEFATHAATWDTINGEHYDHPLLESRFFAAALDHLSNNREQLVVCGPEDRPSAIAILAPTRAGAWTTFQPSQSPLGALVQRPDIEPLDLTQRLFGVLPRSCQILSLSQQDPELVSRPSDHSRLRTLDYIQTARITVDRDFDEYWAGRGKNLRHNMKRQRNRLEREDIDLRLEVLSNPDQIRDGIRSYGQLESAGWKAQGGTAIHPDNDQGRFYSALLESYANTGNARIYRFYYNDQLSAVDLCISNRKALVILKTTYDETVKTSSPALLMRLAYFPTLFDDREVERIEFYGKVMDWHTKWSDEIRTLYHVNAYRHALVARLHNRSS